MEHPFFTNSAATRAEALRWLSIAEKLLSARDLMGSKSFASRAREADPTLSPADAILAVADTLLAGDRRIGNNQPDFYSVLRLTPQQGSDPELVASQYRSLVLLLNPQNNRFPFAEQAFRLVIDAWSVLSNPSRKSLYDNQLGFYLHHQQHQSDPFSLPIPASAPAPQQSFIFAQPQLHGGESSSIGMTTHYAQAQQVQAQSRVGPMMSVPTREPQNFMGFHSGSNIVFGSKPGQEPVNNQGQDNYPPFAGNNVASSAPGVTLDQNNIDKEKQSHQGYSNAGDSHNNNNNNNNVHNVNVVNENVEETVEVEDVDEEVEEEEEEKRDDLPPKNDPLTFWTACPYCYYMYEYPRVYIDCTMRCRNCKRAFQSVVIPSPPPTVDGQDAYFCCWGFMPMGFSMDIYERNKRPVPETGTNSNRRNSGPRVYIDDDDIFADISSSSESDIDWQADKDKKRKSYGSTKYMKVNVSAQTPTRRSKKVLAKKGKKVDVAVSAKTTAADKSELGKARGPRKQPGRVAKSFGKLDLNVELSNEADEPGNKVNEPGRREDDNIEGIGFFEGLDELFSNLPILNPVGDDKAVKAA
ncbi:hypothetical protein CASFOL_035891 [Castilleja foliolosa]|uniref:J domain-containing protein n=1 Tax=Castilleja foliolosa TaxID=1961234 RepID=A0ABD3BV46_9LAMI